MEGSLYIADIEYFKNKKSFTSSNTGVSDAKMEIT